MDIQVLIGKFFQPCCVLENFHDEMLTENHQRMSKQRLQARLICRWPLWALWSTTEKPELHCSASGLWGFSSAPPHSSIPNLCVGPHFTPCANKARTPKVHLTLILACTDGRSRWTLGQALCTKLLATPPSAPNTSPSPSGASRTLFPTHAEPPLGRSHHHTT